MFAQKIKKQIITLFNVIAASLYHLFDIAFPPKQEYVPVRIRVDLRR